MKGNEYNALWAILNNAEESLLSRLPEKFLEFVKNTMVSGVEPDGSLKASGDEPVIPDAAKELLAALSLTYWAESAAQRRSFAQQLHEKELAYAKKEPRPMTEEEYLRDANYRNTPNVAEDVLIEQEKINSADAIAFIYPVFWTEAPAKLVGWFDRVWSYGFAYGEKTMKVLDKALILCSAGNPIERLEELGLLDSMKKVMLGDRLFGRAKQMEFIVFDNTSRENKLRKKNWDANLQKAYEIGKGFL